MAAAATVPLLGAGLVLTFSRGAIAAALVGLLVLALLAPEPGQRQATLVAGIVAALAGAAAALLPAVRTLGGAHRSAEGLAMLAVLVVLGAAAALMARREPAPRVTAAPRRTGLARAAALVAAVLALAALAAALERGPDQRTGASAQRLASTESNRYEYWKVAVRTWSEHPLVGHGSGSFQADWLRERTITEVVRDAHSLYLETAAELGLAGLLLLAAFLGGVLASAVRAHRRAPGAAAGPAAALAVWLVHAGLDWDWEMPALTLVAIALMGALVALADDPAGRSL
jgi:O-antigen ligase